MKTLLIVGSTFTLMGVFVLDVQESSAVCTTNYHAINISGNVCGVCSEEREVIQRSGITVVAIGANNMVTIRTNSRKTFKVKALNAQKLKVGDRKDVRFGGGGQMYHLPLRRYLN